MNTTAAATPPSRNAAAVSGSVIVDTREEERRQRVFLQAAIQGNLHLLAKMAVEVNPVSRGGTGAGDVRSTCGRGALHLAAVNGRTHVCCFLVRDLTVPIDALSTSGETPLLLAAMFGHTVTAAYLLECGAGPSTLDSHGETALHRLQRLISSKVRGFTQKSRYGRRGYVSAAQRSGVEGTV